MRRFSRVRSGSVVAGAALLALVVAGAVVAAVDTGTRDEVASVSRDAAVGPDEAKAPTDAVGRTAARGGGGAVAGSGVASGAAGGGGSASSAEPFPGRAQIAPVPPLPPVPPDGGQSAVVPGSPRVVRTADLRVEVAEGGFGAAFDRVASIAAASGGFVSSSSTASNDGARSGELTVRVPADRFESVRQSLSGLGEVESQSIRGEDVSGQLVDYEARLKSLQAQEEALRVLVGEAKEVGDVLRVQSSLFNVRQQIEQIEAQKANLEQSVSLATIQVSLFEPGATSFRPGGEDRSLARSFELAVDGSLAVVGGMIVVVGYLVPLVALGLLLWGGARIFRRRPPLPPSPEPASAA